MGGFAGHLRESFDPVAYAGRWYEVARYPNPFESRCAAATADYRWNPERRTLDIENRCYDSSGQLVGEPWRASGQAHDPEFPRRLGIRAKDSNFDMPGGYYLHATDYKNWAIVGSDLYFWLLWRRGDPKTGRADISAQEYAELFKRGKEYAPLGWWLIQRV